MDASLDRRGFLKTLAVGSAAAMAAGAGLAGCAPQSKDAAGSKGTVGSGAGVPTSWDEECDVLVIGSGYAGLAAAYEAAKAGANTMIVEKMASTGGNSAIADGDFAVCMSSAQKAKGIEDSVDKYVADMMAAGLNLNDEEKCRVLAEKSNETWEWTQTDLGVEWDTDEEGNINVIPYGGHNTVRTIHPALGHGSAITVPLIEKLGELGASIKTSCMATKFFRDDSGRMVGVQVNEKPKGNNPTTGDPLFIKANKGVVLASGGFGRDIAWRTQHDPRLGEDVDCTNQEGATAEALAAAMKAGALTVHLDWIQLGPWCSPDETGYGKGPSYIDANVAYGMSIDPQTGKRIVNELAEGSPHHGRREDEHGRPGARCRSQPHSWFLRRGRSDWRCARGMPVGLVRHGRLPGERTPSRPDGRQGRGVGVAFVSQIFPQGLWHAEGPFLLRARLAIRSLSRYTTLYVQQEVQYGRRDGDGAHVAGEEGGG